MASNRLPTKRYALIIATLGIIVYASTAVLQDWASEAPFRDREAENLLREQVVSELYASCDRLEQKGALIPRRKMLSGSKFQFVDLAKWHGTNTDLADLKTLAKLPLIRNYDRTLHIRLGTSVTSGAIPILACLGNIESLDLNGAVFTESEVQQIINGNLNCKLSAFSVPP